MKAGGNKMCKDFFESQSDYKQGMSLQEKYNTRAAALLRDKVRIFPIFKKRCGQGDVGSYLISEESCSDRKFNL